MRKKWHLYFALPSVAVFKAEKKARSRPEEGSARKCIRVASLKAHARKNRKEVARAQERLPTGGKFSSIATRYFIRNGGILKAFGP